MSRTLHLFGTDWCAMMVPIQVIRWYRFMRYSGTDSPILSRDMNCIFIDDPIQALDDINILSIIDLLRNVAFSMNKQIVLTTHDRNFFELLQKKAPDTLFNSKFITLPERGKFAYV